MKYPLRFLLLFLLTTVSLQAQVSFVDAQHQFFDEQTEATISNYAVAAGTNRLLVVHWQGTADPTGATFAGSPMVEHETDKIWYVALGDNNSTDNGDITFTFAEPSITGLVMLMSLEGVSQSAPLDAVLSQSTGNGLHTHTVSSQADDLVIDFISALNMGASCTHPTLSIGMTTGQVQRIGASQSLVGGGGVCAAIGASSVPGASSADIAWTAANNGGGDHYAMNVNQVASPVNVGIGTTTPAPSAALDIQSNNQGILVPRLSTAQRMGISAPASGLLVYDTDAQGFYYYENNNWTPILAGTDNVDDADNDPNNELQNWSNLPGIPADFADDTDDVDDADNDPNNELQNWSILPGIPAGFADDTDDVDDADNDPNNELQNWDNLPGIPAGFADGIDNVDDADASTTNEIITSATLNGSTLEIVEAGATTSVDMSGLPITETDPKVGSTLVDYIPKWNGTQLVNSGSIYELNNDHVHIGSYSTTSRLSLFGSFDVTIPDTKSFYIPTWEGGSGVVINGVFDGQGNGAQLRLQGPSNGNFVDIGNDADGNFVVETDVDEPRLTVEQAGNVGIGTTTPEEQLEVAGAIKIGDTTNPTPSVGTVRWNPATEDFEGYTGNRWKSLTKSSGNSWKIDQTLNENNKLLASDGAAGDLFGYSVSMAGDYAIIGAITDDDSGLSSGSAYIFVRNGSTWAQQAKLLANDGAQGDQFGRSVSIAGDYAIVGANLDDDNGIFSGSAYIFVRNGSAWTQQAKLLANDGAQGDHFGRSVSITADYAIIGAYLNGANGGSSGAAYIFARNGTNWVQQIKLQPSTNNDQLGYAVSIAGDYAIIGSPGDADNGANSGSAYIFIRNGTSWTQQAKLLPNDGAPTDRFGGAVSISNDYAIVGAYLDDDNGGNSGSAYIFARDDSNWTQQAKLMANDGAPDDNFGWAVDIAGDYVIVGAHLNDDNGNNTGSAYTFVRNGSTWTQQIKLVTSDRAPDDAFGLSVSITENYAIIGARNDDDNGSDSGSVYIFE